MIEKEQLAALAALEIPIARAGCLKAKSKFPPRPLEFRAFSGRKTARGLQHRAAMALAGLLPLPLEHTEADDGPVRTLVALIGFQA